MIPFRIVTTGVATEHYVVNASNEEEARAAFEAGEVTKAVFTEVDQVEIVKIEAVGDGNAAKQKFVLTAPIWESRSSFEERQQESVVEAIRGFGYPEAWDYYTEPYTGTGHDGAEREMFRCDFEVEASEREIREYLEEIHDQMRTYFGIDYKIVEATA